MSERNYPGAYGALTVHAENLGRSARLFADEADRLLRDNDLAGENIDASRLRALSETVRVQVERLYEAMTEYIPTKCNVTYDGMPSEWWLG